MYRPKTQCGYNSTIVFTLKMEYVSKITIFGLKMTVKSGLKNIFEILHAKKPFVVFLHSVNLL